METLRPIVKEDKPRIMIAQCENCNWYSSLPTTDFRLVEDSRLLHGTIKAHEERYQHKITFSVK